MALFEKGDRVKLVRPRSGLHDSKDDPYWDGKYGRIVGTIDEISSCPFVKWDNLSRSAYHETELELLKTNDIKNTMSISPKVLAKLSVEEQKLHKAGLINDDLALSSCGLVALHEILLKKFEKELVQVAEAVIAEKETAVKKECSAK